MKWLLIIAALFALIGCTTPPMDCGSVSSGDPGTLRSAANEIQRCQEQQRQAQARAEAERIASINATATALAIPTATATPLPTLTQTPTPAPTATMTPPPTATATIAATSTAQPTTTATEVVIVAQEGRAGRPSTMAGDLIVVVIAGVLLIAFGVFASWLVQRRYGGR